jgi:integrase
MARRAKPWFRKARGAWFVTVEGVQHNLGADKKEAFERFYQLMRQPQKRVVSSQSLVAVVDAFLDWVKINRSADTFEWYRYRLQRFCERYPDLRTTDLKPFHVQQWVDSYPDLGRTSRRNYLRSVKRCCKWAVQQGYLSANPVEHLEVPTADRRERRVTTDEYERLLTLICDESLKDLVITTWETGCRPQESLRVEARHVELEHQRWVFPKSEAKGKRQPRIIYMSDTALEITRRRMQQFPTGVLFRNSKGRPWTPDAVNCAFDRLRVKLLRKSDHFDPAALEKEIHVLLKKLSPDRLVIPSFVEMMFTTIPPRVVYCEMIRPPFASLSLFIRCSTGSISPQSPLRCLARNALPSAIGTVSRTP